MGFVWRYTFATLIELFGHYATAFARLIFELSYIEPHRL